MPQDGTKSPVLGPSYYSVPLPLFAGYRDWTLADREHVRIIDTRCLMNNCKHITCLEWKAKKKKDNNWQWNGFRRRKYVFWRGPVKVLTSTRLRLRCHLKRELFTAVSPGLLLSQPKWSKIHSDCCARLICNYKKHLGQLIAAKGSEISN